MDRRAVYHQGVRAIVVQDAKKKPTAGVILVLTAGTSDIPVAEEAAVTAAMLGSSVQTVYDVGVAGIHRILSKKEILDSARVIVVVAGMDGALPSVVGGLVDKPVIAVPTSVGYGAGFQGLAPLLTMLNSCAAGVAVMNIDNGFGAGVMAHRINLWKSK
jgi:NCAIR mutase (PurE)-related protein